MYYNIIYNNYICCILPATDTELIQLQPLFCEELFGVRKVCLAQNIIYKQIAYHVNITHIDLYQEVASVMFAIATQ